MGSRLKENPERIFEGYFEVLCPSAFDKDPELKRQFPGHFDDQESVTTLTKFCFPFNTERWQNSSVQHFSFTLTDLQGFQRFGFCRLSVNAKSGTCILSCLPWFELFYKLLNQIAEHLVKDQVEEVTDILQSLYEQPVPGVNVTLNLEMISSFVVPDPTKLPSIPENRNLTEFLVAVRVDTMLQLYASLLCERRILITSSKLSTLTACVHASAALLYPMYWQHIYIPTLPPHLLDYCGAPMPYLIGVHSSLMEQVTLEDVVIFNMDTNHLETPFHDLDSLPPHVVSLLKLQLTKQSAFMGDGVSQAFLRAQAMLFGSYREALICTPGEPISFCTETFLSHKCSYMRAFLQNAVHLQLFSQFIDSRLEKLNSGDEFTDVFEQEVTKCGLSGASRSYQVWLENLKKGGGTLINNMKNRTQPTVKNMLRYAKGQAKTGLKGMKRRIKHKDQGHMQRTGSFKGEGSPALNHETLQNRLPITQHFGQHRPRRPGKKFPSGDSWASERADADRRRDVEEPAATEEEDDLPLFDDSMDLLNEIFETLNTRAPGGECTLYGAHSLDCFGLDDTSSEEDVRLSLSHPRQSDLWYLQEVDEDTLDSLESAEDSMSSLDNISSAGSENIPLITEAASTNYNLTIHETKEELIEESSPKHDISSSIIKPMLPFLELESDPHLQTSSDGSEVKESPSFPELEASPAQKEHKEYVLPREIRHVSTVTPFIRAGPSVRSVISRFQTGTLDPRMVWTGTKTEGEQAERVIPNFRSINTQRPISQVYSSPKSITPVQRIRPVFLRSQSAGRLEIPTSPESDSTILIAGQDTSVITADDEGHDQQLSPLPSDLKAAFLPKVSELKKKFEEQEPRTVKNFEYNNQH